MTTVAEAIARERVAAIRRINDDAATQELVAGIASFHPDAGEPERPSLESEAETADELAAEIAAFAPAERRRA